MAQIKINHFRHRTLSGRCIAIDSMCFIYHFARHPLYSPLTRVFFAALEHKEIFVVTSMLTITEVFVHAERSHDRLILHEYERFFHSFDNLQIIPVDWYIARAAARLRSEYATLRTPDAVQVATAMIGECSTFMTNDKRLRKIVGVNLVLLDDYV